MQEMTKMYQSELANSINNPSLIDCERKAKSMIIQLQKLCELKKPMCFIFDGSVNCTVCEKHIGNEKFITLNCFHNIHIDCGKNKALSVSRTLDTNIFIECGSCKQLWTHDNIVQLFGRQEYQRIQEEGSFQLIQQMQQGNKHQQKVREQNRKFTCQMCFEDKVVNDNCITLDCDHRYCKICIKNFIIDNLTNGRVKENQLICLLCSVSISPQILQGLTTREQFEQISVGRLDA